MSCERIPFSASERKRSWLTCSPLKISSETIFSLTSAGSSKAPGATWERSISDWTT